MLISTLKRKCPGNVPGHFHVACKLVLAASLAAPSALAAPPAIVHTRWTPSTSTASCLGRPDCNWCALNAVEVRLVLFVELLAFFLFKVVSTLDQDGALIGFGLALVELVARTSQAPGSAAATTMRAFVLTFRAGAVWASFAFCSLISALRLSLMRLPSMARTLTIT